MSGATDYLEDAWIDCVLRGTTFTTPGQVYVALFKIDPQDDPANDAPTGENTDSAYLRQGTGVTPASAWDAPTAGDGLSSNNNVLTYPAIAGGAVTVTHFAIYDAAGASTPPVATEGNPLLHAGLTSSKTLDPSDVASFPVGSLTVTVA